MSDTENKTYWFEKDENKDRLFYWLIGLAAIVALPDILSLLGVLYETHPYTKAEEIPVFYGLYAAIGMLIVLTIGRVLSHFLTVREDYYD